MAPDFPERVDRPNIVVTGARGKLARFIIHELEPRYPLILTDISPPDGNETAYRQADLTDFGQTLDAVQGADIIIHTAITQAPDLPPGTKPPDREIADYDRRMLCVNPSSTFHLLEAAVRCGVRRMIYTSSLTVQLGNRRQLHYSERDVPTPNGLYSCTKLFGEHIGEVYVRNYGLEVLSLRIGQPFPIGHSHDVTWKKSRRARSTFVAVEDVARAFRCAVETPVKSGIFNIVSASDNQRFDLSAARRIGYRPIAYFSDEGLSFHPDGNTPLSERPLIVED